MKKLIPKRNNYYLLTRLNHVWSTYFSDILKTNPVKISFGRKNKTRLGSIKQEKDKFTVIKINGRFQDNRIPEYVIDTTIAHELCHYAHGFCSPRKKCFRYPHQGGIVNKEMDSRGLRELRLASRQWFGKSWRKIVKSTNVWKTFADMLI
ncbi:MAG: hypothetical protein ACD_63C00146G0010 [uncultured bacterium]|nr:MAG: hypothetical protein ACD_63C00146G0010 [uncultured bacterium]